MPDDRSKGLETSYTGPGQGLIQYYEKLAQVSHRMLESAHRGDWTGVWELEEQCRALIASLRHASQRAALTEDERARRLALLRAILNDDARIRTCAEPWLRDLDAFLE